jgi:hypothetical protein
MALWTFCEMSAGKFALTHARISSRNASSSVVNAKSMKCVSGQSQWMIKKAFLARPCANVLSWLRQNPI